MPSPLKIIIIDTGAPKGQTGRSFVGGDPDPADRNGHATNVAEVIRQRAPAAQLLFFKAVPKSGRGSPTDLANALFAAAAESPAIVNISLAVPRGEPRLRRAVKTLRATGALIVCGAGNDAAAGIQWPARYPETVSVGALGSDGKPAKFSPGGCDLMLPGERVPVRIRGHGRAPISGTSIACAVASGMLAAAMASGARDALEEIRNYSQQQERTKMSLKSKIKTKLETLIDKWLKRLLGKLPAEAPAETPQPAPAETPQTAPAETPQTQPATAADAVPFGDLEWCYGGYNGKNAQLADGCRISDLRVGGGKMSYRWAEGDCAPLGGPVKSDAVCIAALFVRDASGAWRGGKFEWVGTSRTTRSLGNIAGEYHGWPANAVETATAFAFVIVSKDGKLRSNVIAQGV